MEEQQQQLKSKMDEQEQQLRRKREELDLKSDLAASNAKLAVLQAWETKSYSSKGSDGMNSYFEKGKKKEDSVVVLNPMVKEYEPTCRPVQQIHWAQSSLPPDNHTSMDVRPKQPV